MFFSSTVFWSNILFCLFSLLILSFNIFFLKIGFMVSFSFFSIRLSRSHNLGHEFAELTQVGSTLITWVICLSYFLELTQADFLPLVLSNFVIPRFFLARCLEHFFFFFNFLCVYYHCFIFFN